MSFNKKSRLDCNDPGLQYTILKFLVYINNFSRVRHYIPNIIAEARIIPVTDSPRSNTIAIFLKTAGLAT